ncbi:MAG: ABC transporter, substrate-binding protein (cluster 3, basic aa/glutamine/opines) [uncultured Nocardioidaceae bacterium]|uniref:ABC transporter, substrate-binding protein (Cluster 3, basic aa/glutamine/opines) n=1 Tax=uncultured Nocardioidaceae bacterium TaxID=253824 RepID=A0A6J4L8L1_9ACTN|nr:MAG: ABC transporter, substrate-binding protein (cluster 3, basic aa/glutamine/opines) [uncultured Nocardioidaceae bacterium]
MDTRFVKTLAAVALVPLLLVSCAANDDSTALEGGEKVVAEGKLTVCTHLPYEPFQYQEDGQIVGFDVDMVDLVAKELGVEQTIVNTPFETIETGQAMSTGKCDLAAAGMTITEERSRVMDFSDPYFNATQALLVQKGAGYDSLESLSGKTLGVQTGTTGQEYAEENAPADVELKVFEDLALLSGAVKTGSVDAGINDNGVLYDYVEQNPDTEVSIEFDTGEQYGFAVAKDQNDALLDTTNQVLDQAKQDGTYEKLFRKYFPDAELPGFVG